MNDRAEAGNSSCTTCDSCLYEIGEDEARTYCDGETYCLACNPVALA